MPRAPLLIAACLSIAALAQTVTLTGYVGTSRTPARGDAGFCFRRVSHEDGGVTTWATVSGSAAEGATVACP